MKHKIYPIPTCRLTVDKGTFTYRNFYGEKVWFPVYAWLIKGDRKPFLIDTGCSAKEAGELSAYFVGEEGLPIEESLQKMGISMSEIETIILTQMHIDHFLNAKKFPNAKIIVQEEELKIC